MSLTSGSSLYIFHSPNNQASASAMTATKKIVLHHTQPPTMSKQKQSLADQRIEEFNGLCCEELEQSCFSNLKKIQSVKPFPWLCGHSN
jgi:hypothetical protein